MTKLNVTDRDGVERQVIAPGGVTLMEALRDNDSGVLALCGGMCSCATCHVYIDADWIAKLPAAQSDETELLKELSGYQSSSRLSCQIPLLPAYDGLKVIVAPEE